MFLPIFFLDKTENKEPPNTIDKRAVQLLTFFDKLNDLGKQNAIEYLGNISSLSKYAIYIQPENKNIGYTIAHGSTKQVELCDDDIAEIIRIRRNITEHEDKR